MGKNNSNKEDTVKELRKLFELMENEGFEFDKNCIERVLDTDEKSTNITVCHDTANKVSNCFKGVGYYYMYALTKSMSIEGSIHSPLRRTSENQQQTDVLLNSKLHLKAQQEELIKNFSDISYTTLNELNISEQISKAILKFRQADVIINKTALSLQKVSEDTKTNLIVAKEISSILKSTVNSLKNASAFCRWFLNIKKNIIIVKCRFSSSSVTANEVGIQLLPEYLRCDLFPKTATDFNSNKKYADLSKLILKHQNLLGKNSKPLPDMNFLLPSLTGSDIEQHFEVISKFYCKEYLQLSEALIKNKQPVILLEKLLKETKWNMDAGWTRYPLNGKICKVDFPLEKSLVLDVEVLVSDGPFPIMATAASTEAWYGWVSPKLSRQLKKMRKTAKDLNSLIPLGPRNEEKIIVGHNVGYDRIRLKDGYSMEVSKTRYIDTMSLHMCVGGLSNQQRPFWQKYKNLREKKNEAETEEEKFMKEAELRSIEQPWLPLVATNSLKEVSYLYLGISMDKSVRNVFVDGNIDEIVDRFQELMNYCANDVLITYKLYRELFPLYRKKCPSDVTFFGMLEMSTGFLPVTEDWEKFIKKADKIVENYNNVIEQNLTSSVEKALTFQEDERWKSDPWLKNLDWTVKEKRNKNPNLVGKPQWWRDLWCPKEQQIKITTKKRITPYLLNLCYLDYPLYHSKKFGWTFKVPKENKLKLFKKIVSSNPSSPEAVDEKVVDKEFDKNIYLDREKFNYFKLPHKDGEGKNCGNPLSKQFLSCFESGVLGSNSANTIDLLKKTSQMSYWAGARNRIVSQVVIWNDIKNGKGDLQDMIARDRKSNCGVILPQTVPMGTVTRRAVEPLWMTAANAKLNSIGSELKAKIQAPFGYKFVGADVDSEELWIASLLGDSQFGIHGSTPLGFMTLQGSKSQGTDMHSVTAKILDISRDNAKVFNYARIYGAQQNFAENILKQFSPNLEKSEIKSKSLKLYKETKGVWMGSKSRNAESGYWSGGSESYTFNKLEEIARMEEPETPALKCKIPEGLSPSNLISSRDFLKSRVNWVVQSSGVDYLHLLLISMRYLCDIMNIDARFILSIHDEVRFMVKENGKNEYLAALALQISNVWTRAVLVNAVGMKDLPLSIAFFSAVDVDHCLRKEVTTDCLTLSNDIPEAKGESLDIYQILQKLNVNLDNSKEIYFEDTVPGLKDFIKFELHRKNQEVIGTDNRKVNSKFLSNFDKLLNQFPAVKPFFKDDEVSRRKYTNRNEQKVLNFDVNKRNILDDVEKPSIMPVLKNVKNPKFKDILTFNTKEVKFKNLTINERFLAVKKELPLESGEQKEINGSNDAEKISTSYFELPIGTRKNILSIPKSKRL
ncbi:DNA-directed DNA polymerase gamma mip1 [Lobulomyces angularis]|nr:DNA-directed DNA polymerase gamma mip1 [Lobulomyces angularis]